MSAIAAIIGETRGIDHRLLLMLRAQEHRGPDGSSVRSFAAGAFGHAALFTTPESLHDQQPCIDTATGCVITADVRIDNRSELLAQLGLGPQVGEAELALLAYLRWGRHFVKRLHGSFAMAIWDPRSNDLHLYRDHFSTRPILYTTTRHSIVVASTAEAVCAGSEASHPVYLAKLQHFLVEPLSSGELSASIFDQIHLVPAACLLTWSLVRGVRVERYWIQEQPQRLVLANDGDYQEAFADTLATAVKASLRCNGPVTATLSGGVDSTAIVAEAAAHQDLLVCGGVETRPGEGSDTPFICDVLRALDLEANLIDEEQVALNYDLAAILAVPSSLFDVYMALHREIVRRTHEVGSRVLLTGVGPDSSLALDPFWIGLQSLQSGEPLRAWREVREWEGQRSPISWVLKRLVKTALPEPATSWLRDLRAAHRFETELRSVGIEPNPATFARLQQLLHELTVDPEWNTPNDRLNRIRHPFDRTGLERYDRVGARYGVEIRNPFMDRRFIDFCLSLPPEQVHRQGLQKWILREHLVRRALPRSVAMRHKSPAALSPFIRAVAQSRPTEFQAEEAFLDLQGVLAPFRGVERARTSEWVWWKRSIVQHFAIQHLARKSDSVLQNLR